MKKILICLFLLFCIGCTNTAIKPEAFPKENLKIYTVNKRIDFVGLKNNENFKNSFGYSYFSENMSLIFEKQGLMKDKSGYLADEINLSSLREYNTDSRYIVFAEIKNYNYLIKEDIDSFTHTILGLCILELKNKINNFSPNLDSTYIAYNLDANFYLYDRKTERIVKRIPVVVNETSIIPGSWSNTGINEQQIIANNYLNHIYNIIAEQLKNRL